MLFASIFLSLDLREVLTLDLYHRVAFAKTSKPLQPHVSYLYYILLTQTWGVGENRVTVPKVRFAEWERGPFAESGRVQVAESGLVRVPVRDQGQVLGWDRVQALESDREWERVVQELLVCRSWRDR